MKNLMLLTLTLCSFSASADEYLPLKKLKTDANIEGVRGGYTSVVDEGDLPQQGDVPFVIKDPKVKGTDIFFTKGSHGPALCNYLGYQKYVKNSMTHTEFTDDSEDGIMILKTEFFAWFYSRALHPYNLKRIGEITCLNMSESGAQPTITKFTDPVYPGTNISIATNSDPDGVCNLLGHGSHIYDSMIPKLKSRNNPIREIGFTIGTQGNVKGQRHGPVMQLIVCIKR